MARPSYQKVTVSSKPEFYASYTVPVGTPVIITPAILPLEVTAVPGSGGTLLVETRTVSNGAWVAWPAGTVGTTTSLSFDGRCHSMRFTATVGAGLVEVAG